MMLPSMLQGDSIKRLLQGAAAGAAVTLVLGFGWAGWRLDSKAQKMATERASAAVVDVLRPICVDNFRRNPDVATQLAALKATDSWKQDTYIKEHGWATFAGSEKPNTDVAEACASTLVKAEETPVKKAAK